MEVGGATEPTDRALFEKVPVFWGPGGGPPLRAIYRSLLKLRKQYPVFSSGEVVWLENTTTGEAVSFLRRDGKDEFLVLIKLSSRRVPGSVELSNPEGFEPVKISGWPPPIDIS